MPFKRIICLQISFVALVGLISCKTMKNTSEVTHTPNDYYKDTESFLWAETSDIDLKNILEEEDQRSLENNHPMVLYLNKILDRIHQNVLRLDPRVVAPKPRVAIVEDQDQNAYSPYMTKCIELEGVATIDREIPGNNSSDVAMVLQVPSQHLMYRSRIRNFDSKACMKMHVKSPLVTKILKFHIPKYEQCITQTENGFNVNTQECFSSTPGRLRYIHYSAISNYMVLFTGMIKETTEEELISVIAHELAHYYKLHAFSPESYEYFYKLDDHKNEPKKPGREHDQTYREIWMKTTNAKKRTVLANHPINFNQIHAIGFNWVAKKFMSNYVNGMCSRAGDAPTCVTKCAPLNKLYFEIMSKFSNYINFPFVVKWELPATKYSEFEEKVKTCFENLRPNDHLAYISESNSKFLIDVGLFPDKIASFSNMYELLKFVSEKGDEKIKRYNDEILEFIHLADKNQLGYYTGEQEADELSIEMLLNIGIDPKVIQELQLKLLKDSSENTNPAWPGILGYEACKKAVLENFPNFVPIGDYITVHHSHCFRIYNVVRELRAHSEYYQKLKTEIDPYVSNPDTWNSLVDSIN